MTIRAASDSLLAPVAGWVTSDQPADILLNDREAFRQVVLDWLAALAAGWPLPGAVDLARVAEQNGRAGQAFLLGSVSHLAEVDDGHRSAMMHPGIVTLSSIMALVCGHQAVPLGTFATAISAGYESSVRVGAALGKSHYGRFHTTATAGSFGAAAAAGVILGLDRDALVAAMAHAGAQANGPWQFLEDGADVAKALNGGFAARNGVTGASLAAAGIAAAPRILEGTRGLAREWSDAFDPAPLIQPFRAEQSAVLGRTVKTWQVCGQMHHVLDAITSLMADGLTATGIGSLRIESFAALIDVAGNSDPKTLAQARFSTAFCVAHLLCRGTLGFDDLKDQLVLDDPEIRALMPRIQLDEDPQMTKAYPNVRRCRVTSQSSEGDEKSVEWTGRRGDPEQPLGPAEFDTRFRQLTSHMPPDWHRSVARLETILTEGRSSDELPPALLREVVDAPGI